MCACIDYGYSSVLSSRCMYVITIHRLAHTYMLARIAHCHKFVFIVLLRNFIIFSHPSSSPSSQDALDPFELASVFITAVIHDLDHPGRTNPFLTNSRHDLAILYNDRYCMCVCVGGGILQWNQIPPVLYTGYTITTHYNSQLQIFLYNN